MNRILKQADIGPEHHLLEIGCGWGGFAVFAAKKIGCRVTGITVSKAQYERARQRVKDEGLEDQITILLQDYRHIKGNFHRIISIEMIEAVGPEFFGQYFRQCKDLLQPGGKMVFQAIIIADERYDQYCKERTGYKNIFSRAVICHVLKFLKKPFTTIQISLLPIFIIWALIMPSHCHAGEKGLLNTSMILFPWALTRRFPESGCIIFQSAKPGLMLPVLMISR